MPASQCATDGLENILGAGSGQGLGAVWLQGPHPEGGRGRVEAPCAPLGSEPVPSLGWGHHSDGASRPLPSEPAASSYSLTDPDDVLLGAGTGALAHGLQLTSWEGAGSRPVADAARCPLPGRSLHCCMLEWGWVGRQRPREVLRHICRGLWRTPVL